MVHGKFLGLKLNSSSSLGHGAPDLLVHDLQSSAHHRDYGCRWTDLIQKGCTGVFLLRSKVFNELCLASSLLSGEEAHALFFQTKAPLCFPPRITNGIVAFESIPFPNNGWGIFFGQAEKYFHCLSWEDGEPPHVLKVFAGVSHVFGRSPQSGERSWIEMLEKNFWKPLYGTSLVKKNIVKLDLQVHFKIFGGDGFGELGVPPSWQKSATTEKRLQDSFSLRLRFTNCGFTPWVLSFFLHHASVVVEVHAHMC